MLAASSLLLASSPSSSSRPTVAHAQPHRAETKWAPRRATESSRGEGAEGLAEGSGPDPPSPPPPPTPPSPSNRWWKQLREKPDPVHGVPRNRRAASSTVYARVVETPAVVVADADLDNANGTNADDHNNPDANRTTTTTTSYLQEWMIVSGGYTDDDWSDFPVWAYDLTASRKYGAADWIPLHVVDGKDDNEHGENEQTNGEESHRDGNQETKEEDHDERLQRMHVDDEPSPPSSPLAPKGRIGHLSVVYDDHLYVFGGLSWEGRRFVADQDTLLWRASLEGRLPSSHDNSRRGTPSSPRLDWERVEPIVVGDPPAAAVRCLARGEAQGGLVWPDDDVEEEEDDAFGGSDDESGNSSSSSPLWVFHGGLHVDPRDDFREIALGDAWSYDLRTNELELLHGGRSNGDNAAPVARTAHAAAVVRGELVVYGGMADASGLSTDNYRADASSPAAATTNRWAMLNDVWSLSPRTRRWRRWDMRPALGRSYHTLVGWDGRDERRRRRQRRRTSDGGGSAHLDEYEREGRDRGSIVAYGGFRTSQTVAGEQIAFVFSDTLVAHPPPLPSPSDTPFLANAHQLSGPSVWFKAQWPPGASLYDAVSHRLEHTSVVDSAGIVYVWGGRFKAVSQISGLWSLDLFGEDSTVSLALADPDGLDDYEARLETLHLLVAVVLFASVLLTALYGTLRGRAEEMHGAAGMVAADAAAAARRHVGVLSGRQGGGRGVSREIMDTIPVKTWRGIDTNNSLATTTTDGDDLAGRSPNNDNDVSECCAICLVEYEEGDEIRALPCNHYFHKDCVDSWLENNVSCPTCRHSLYDRTWSSEDDGTTSVTDDAVLPSFLRARLRSMGRTSRRLYARNLGAAGVGRRRRGGGGIDGSSTTTTSSSSSTRRRWVGALSRRGGGTSGRRGGGGVGPEDMYPDDPSHYVSTLELDAEVSSPPTTSVTTVTTPTTTSSPPLADGPGARSRGADASRRGSGGGLLRGAGRRLVRPSRRSIRRVVQGETELVTLNHPLRENLTMV